MTPTDPYAGASQSAADVRERAIGAAEEIANPRRAESDGYMTGSDGVRRKVIAGDQIPADAELEGTKATEAAPENKAKRAPAENK